MVTRSEPDGGSSDTLTKLIRKLVDPSNQADLITCIDELHDSWQTGLTELFASEDEDQIAFHLQCLQNLCLNRGVPDDTGEYDVDTLLDNCVVLVYLGVRFQ